MQVAPSAQAVPRARRRLPRRRPLIVARPPVPGERLAEDTLVIVCPWLASLPMPSGLWVSALPIHDANAFVDDERPYDIALAHAASVYFAVFAIDPFRTPDALAQRLLAKGVRRIVNLPSVSFFDAGTAEVFAGLNLGPAQERAFLKRTTALGLRVGLCTRSDAVPPPSERVLYDFVVCHDGPGSGLELFEPEGSEHG
jgi:predicted TIM-barrel enzyme